MLSDFLFKAVKLADPNKYGYSDNDIRFDVFL